MNSKREIVIELFEEYKNVNFYTFRFVDETESETEKFLLNHIDEKDLQEDLGTITRLFERIGNSEYGAVKGHFRNAGSKKDSTAALPGYIYSGKKLRLYVLRHNDNIVILGNGGRKKTKTYNEDEHLDNCVENLKKIDAELKISIKQKKTSIDHKEIKDNLNFKI